MAKTTEEMELELELQKQRRFEAERQSKLLAGEKEVLALTMQVNNSFEAALKRLEAQKTYLTELTAFLTAYDKRQESLDTLERSVLELLREKLTKDGV
jgi:type II secretory pathway component PulM